MKPMIMMTLWWLVLSLKVEASGQEHNKMGVHGMLLFGHGDQWHVSHLPLFAHPHDQQVIATVEFEPVFDAQSAPWSQAPGLMTVVPEPFDLNLISQPRLTLQVDLYAGHFERGGTRQAHAVSMTITGLIINQPLLPDTASTTLTYQRLSADPEADVQYYARLINQRPAADHIVAIQATKALPEFITHDDSALFMTETQIAAVLQLKPDQVQRVYLEINELR